MKLLRERIENADTVTKEGRYYIEGIFMQGELVNANGRMYPISVLAKAVREYNERFIAPGRSAGELNHPDSPQINYERACIRTTELYQDGNNIMGRALVLATPLGQLVESLLKDGITIGVSSRGVASIKKDKGIDVVEEDFQICAAADVVSDPSAPDAFVNHVVENKEWIYESGVWSPRQLEVIQKTIRNTKTKAETMRAYKVIAESLVKNLRFSKR